MSGRLLYRVTWIVLVAVVFGLAVATTWDGGSARPSADPRLLLDAEALLRSDGTEFAFTVRQPSRIRVFVHLPMDLSGTIRVGPAAPAKKRDIAYVPHRDVEWTFKASGTMATPFERTVMAVGSYFVRVDPIPTAMGEGRAMVRAVVWADPLVAEDE